MKFANIIGLLFFIAAALGPIGCSAHRTTSPGANLNIPHLGSFQLTGDADAPAVMSLESAEQFTELPAGTLVQLDAAGAWSFTSAAPIRIGNRGAALSLTGPSAFAPPASPTPSDAADGRARWFAWVAIGLGVCAAAFGLLKGWPAIGAGGGCVAAAGVAVLAVSAIPKWVLGLGGVGLLLALGGWAFWTFYLRDKMEPRDAAGAPGGRAVTA